MKKTFTSALLGLLFAFMLTSCSTPYGSRSLGKLDQLIRDHQLHKQVFVTKNHKILGVIAQRNREEIHIYIEGDGLAWASPYDISTDPTPTEPTALQLALADQSKATVVYLARPGHYIHDSRLTRNSWSFARFSAEVIASYQEIINGLKHLYPQATVSLYGYSGGATVALLVAAQDRSIQKVVTFAGLLDHKAWTKFHGYTDLAYSLNPSEYLSMLAQLKQIHYSGDQDSVIPYALAKAYKDLYGSDAPIQLISVPEVDHWQGWEAFWRKASSKTF
jgi:pimeloyl-ACP methyl ester carboxylesterase